MSPPNSAMDGYLPVLFTVKRWGMIKVYAITVVIAICTPQCVASSIMNDVHTGLQG